jgi:uncharacterized OsmC-like protein
MLSVTTSLVESRTLLGRARQHSVLTDRTSDSGGHDLGCTSGELMLLAIGSCVIGNIARCAAERNIMLKYLHAEVSVADTPDDGSYGPVDVMVELTAEISDDDLAALRVAARSGRVTGRVSRNTEVRICLEPVAKAGHMDDSPLARTLSRRHQEA